MKNVFIIKYNKSTDLILTFNCANFKTLDALIHKLNENVILHQWNSITQNNPCQCLFFLKKRKQEELNEESKGPIAYDMETGYNSTEILRMMSQHTFQGTICIPVLLENNMFFFKQLPYTIQHLTLW